MQPAVPAHAWTPQAHHEATLLFFFFFFSSLSNSIRDPFFPSVPLSLSLSLFSIILNPFYNQPTHPDLLLFQDTHSDIHTPLFSPHHHSIFPLLYTLSHPLLFLASSAIPGYQVSLHCQHLFYLTSQVSNPVDLGTETSVLVITTIALNPLPTGSPQSISWIGFAFLFCSVFIPRL